MAGLLAPPLARKLEWGNPVRDDRGISILVGNWDSADSGGSFSGQIDAFPFFLGPGKAGFYREFDREFTGKPTGK